MSHYKPYPVYKDSGVEWIGKLPEHWGLIQLKWDLTFLTSGSRGWADHYADDGALFIRIGNLTRDTTALNLSDIQRVAVPEGAEGERTMVRPGDLLFSITAFLGSVAVIPKHLEIAYVSQHVALARLSRRVLNSEWAGYVALSWVGKTYLDSQGYGGTKIQLSLDDVANMIMIAPPLEEQSCIVNVLNRETARIDGLVSRKKRFIELLREKRQAMISHVVTKGLDPSAPMRDSCAEWLGKVPAHWDVTRVKYAIRSIGQGWSPECESRPADEAEWGVLKVGCVNGGVFRSVENKALPATLAPRPDLALRKGDVLVSRANTRELVGGCAFIEQDFPRLMICDKLYRLNVDANRTTPAFLAALIAVHGRREVELEATGASASMVNIAQSVICNLQIALPPLNEQIAIISAVTAETLRYDTLISTSERSIELLKERRSALITAAVTGQVDLREAA